MGKLIVLITNSDFDLGQIANRVKKDITYIDCDTGKWDPELTKCENLLAIIELHPSREKTAKNAITDNDKQYNSRCFTEVLKECHNYQTVAGVHGISPDKVLAILQFPNVSVTHYSIGWQQFQFIKSWFKELAKEEPNSEKIKQGFLDLFELFKKNSITQHYILHLFLPLDIDMQALGKIEKSERYKYLQRMYVDNIDYLHKFRNLKTRVEGLGENGGIDKARLHEIVGITNDNVSQFFEKLQNKVMIPDDLLAHVWGIEGVQTFPDWYCALVSCLKSNEAELESRIGLIKKQD